MAADAPHVLIALPRQMLVTDHHVVDIGGFVGEVVEAALVAADTEEGVMVDIAVAAVEAVERADDVALLPGIELIRAAEAEHLAVPAEGLVEILRHDDKMAEPLDVRGTALDPEELALTAVLVVAGIDRRTVDLDRIEQRHAVDDLDLVAVGIGQAHPLAAAGLVDVLDRGSALDTRHSLEVVIARGVNGDPDIPWFTQFGDVDMVRRISAAHVEGGLGPIDADHAEIGQELFLLIEIGRPQPPVSEIEGFDDGHDKPPCNQRIE